MATRPNQDIDIPGNNSKITEFHAEGEKYEKPISKHRDIIADSRLVTVMLENN